MSFKLVYLSQQDPKWKADILGFGDAGDTIGYIGCALTATAMLLSGHGYNETPKSLNQKLKNVNGFVSAAIRWGAVSQVYPQVTVKSSISCPTTPAPLEQIDAAIAAGQPAIVQVDYSPASGIQTHWVVLYARKGDDYLMLDPWPYQPDITKEDYLMKRYAQGLTLKRAISHVILYEAYGSGGPISTPSTTTTTPPSSGQPTAESTTMVGPYARVKADVTWGLNVRSSIDTSSMANVLVSVPAGTLLSLIETDGAAKIGAINQWIRVRAPQGQEGFAAAWYLEKGPGSAPTQTTESTTSPTNEAPTNEMTPAPTESTPATESSPEKSKLVVKVKKNGLSVYESASAKGKVVCTEKTGAKLVVVEEAGKAVAKIGAAGKWLNVKATNNKRGYVDAGSVKLA